MNQPSFAHASLLVVLGGGAGSWLRFSIGRLLAGRSAAFPWATLTVNVIGSFAMGMLVGWLARQGGGESWRLLLGVGMLGGFTTFSAFSLEIAAMIERNAAALAAGYVALSLVAGVGGLFAGLALTRAAA